MSDISQAMLSIVDSGSKAHAGYTYIGQMIAHDIVPPTTPNTNNNRGNIQPELNLDSLYGTENRDSSAQLNNKGKFQFQILDDDCCDFLRDKNNVAKIAEPRNDENILLSQLCVFWQKLHNHIVELPDIKTPNEARRVVTIVFQLVVINDFLQHILKKNIYHSIFKNDQTLLNSPIKISSGSLPDFFSKAAFRFGHSVIRNTYRINDKLDLSLDKIFHRSKTFPIGKKIKWSLFFSNTETAQRSNSFDTHIAKAMCKVPNEQAGQAAHCLPKLNLEASKSLTMTNLKGLFKDTDLVPNLTNADFQKSIFNRYLISIEQLPLWAYLLLEAEIQTKGSSLGTAGSILVAETIKKTIQEANHSVFSKTKDPHIYNIDYALSSIGVFGLELRTKIETVTDGEQKYSLIMPALLDMLHIN